MLKEYSKIRLLLSLGMTLLLCAFVVEVICSNSLMHPIGFAIVIALTLAPICVATILLTLNNRSADYLAFSIFTFGFVVEVTVMLSNFILFEFNFDETYWYLTNNKLETSFLIISGLILTYLITSFFRIKNINE